MTDDRHGMPASSDLGITERTAEAHRASVVAELEAENDRLRQRADALQALLDQQSTELRAFGLAAKVLHGARRVVREPRLLGRVPGAVLRIGRDAGGEGSTPAWTPPREPAPPRRLDRPGPPGQTTAARSPATLTIGLVADEQLALALAPECTTIALTPLGWRAAVAAQRPDLVLVESAWRAGAGAWQYRIAWYGHPTSIQQADLRALTEWCRANGVPTIFWDTAGPTGRGRFDEAAARFDVILAADPANLANYDRLPGRRAPIVDVLPAGVQFRRHHPPSEAGGSRSGAQPGPIFVGAYDRARSLPDREALDRLLDAGLAHGLRIFDTGGIAGPDAPGFPARFQAAIQPFLGADERADQIRSAAVVLIDAPGPPSEMIPPSLLEAIASGAPVLSTPSAGIHDRFGGSLPGAASTDDPAAELDRILADPAGERARIRRDALPVVAREFAIGPRLGRLAAAAGLAIEPEPTRVAVLVLHDTPGATDWIADALARMSGAAEFVVGSTDPDRTGAELAGLLRAAHPRLPVRLIAQPGGAADSLRLARLAEATDADWLAPWAGHGEKPSADADPDPLASILVEIAVRGGERVEGADRRLPYAVRRGTAVAER